MQNDMSIGQALYRALFLPQADIERLSGEIADLMSDILNRLDTYGFRKELQVALAGPFLFYIGPAVLGEKFDALVDSQALMARNSLSILIGLLEAREAKRSPKKLRETLSCLKDVEVWLKGEYRDALKPKRRDAKKFLICRLFESLRQGGVKQENAHWHIAALLCHFGIEPDNTFGSDERKRLTERVRQIAMSKKRRLVTKQN